MISVDKKRTRCQSENDSTNKIFWKSKKLDANYTIKNVGNDQSMLLLSILEKIKETRLTFSKESVTVL